VKKVRFFDSTLRDGSHAIRHQLTEEVVREYCKIMDESGVYTIIVGHGNGLGASSLHIGLSLLSDGELIAAARESLFSTKLGVYLIPGFGTIHDDIVPAIENGVDLFKIGCHCTEADTTRQHIEYVRKLDKEVYGILMMYHMASPERIVEEARKMQSYGVQGIILMDSAGVSTPDMVKKYVSMLYDNLHIAIGFHSHNNLGMAVANAYIALEEGASIVDGTIRGFGAGAGNCQIEALAALLEKCGYKLDIDLYRMFNASENVIKPIMPEAMGLSDVSIVSGMAGVFSAFKVPVQNVAKEFGVDPRDVFIELGRRRVVAGQEDMIIEIAKMLADKIKTDLMSYEISSLL
jgi:4-hydroxy 2-oxovalerate aldolase